jgi:dipeptidase
VAHLRKGVHSELGVLWIAATTAVTAPFVPFHLGVQHVPPEYQRHRYLTGGEAARFKDPAFQGLESTRYAFRIYKRLYYLVMEHPEKFLPEVTEALKAFETGLIAQQANIERTALTLYQAGELELARDYLTYYSHTEAIKGLGLGEALSHSIETRTKVLYGIREPASED